MNKILNKRIVVNDVIRSEPGAGKERAAAGIKKLIRMVSKPARVSSWKKP